MIVERASTPVSRSKRLRWCQLEKRRMADEWTSSILSERTHLAIFLGGREKKADGRGAGLFRGLGGFQRTGPPLPRCRGLVGLALSALPWRPCSPSFLPSDHLAVSSIRRFYSSMNWEQASSGDCRHLHHHLSMTRCRTATWVRYTMTTGKHTNSVASGHIFTHPKRKWPGREPRR